VDAKTVDGGAARTGRRGPGCGLQHAARGRKRLGDRAVERRGLTLGGRLILFEATCQEPADTTVHAQGHLGHFGVGRRRQHHRTQRLARGRWENLWASEQPSIVRLADEQAQLGKAVYALTNPVAAGLVTEHHHWPGVISLLARMARPLVYKRPVGFFRENGPLPRHATLTIAPLPGLAHAPQDECLATLRTAVVARETELARERQSTGRSVLGRRQVLRQSAFSSPGSSEPRRQRSPRVAGGNKWARIQALARLRSFLAGYREAWLQWRAGARGVVFPFGTYGLRVYAGVCCAQAP
jgi:hypothetical protein